MININSMTGKLTLFKAAVISEKDVAGNIET